MGEVEFLITLEIRGAIQVSFGDWVVQIRNAICVENPYCGGITSLLPNSLILKNVVVRLQFIALYYKVGYSDVPTILISSFASRETDVWVEHPLETRQF